MVHLIALPDPTKVGGKYLDNGFWRITEATARKLCKPDPLPRHGYFKVVKFDGFYCEVHRTIVGRKQVWALMTTARSINP